MTSQKGKESSNTHVFTNTKKNNKLTEKWGVEIDDEILVQALTHRSFAYEVGTTSHNERLEFLGDSVLGIIVTEYLYKNFPELPEGKLASMRAATVSQHALSQIARSIKLGKYILLGKGEILSKGNDKDSILSDTFEALIGATYLCKGLEETRAVVERLLKPLLDNVVERSEQADWKTSLQELVVARDKTLLPVYTVEGTGPAHDRRYTAEVTVEDWVYGKGSGTSKKQAEQNAARMAVKSLQLNQK